MKKITFIAIIMFFGTVALAHADATFDYYSNQHTTYRHAPDYVNTVINTTTYDNSNYYNPNSGYNYNQNYYNGNNGTNYNNGYTSYNNGYVNPNTNTGSYINPNQVAYYNTGSSNTVTEAPVTGSTTNTVKKSTTTNTINTKKATTTNTSTAVKSDTATVNTSNTTVDPNSLTGLAVYGSNNFLPDSILEWIITFFLILIVIILIRQLRPKHSVAHH